MNNLLAEYDATIDSKRRLVLKGLPEFDHYHVEVYKNCEGVYTVEMKPRVLASLDQLSDKARAEYL